MGIKTVLGASFLILALVSSTWAQQGPPYPQVRPSGPVPYGQTPAVPYGAGPVQGSGYQPQAPSYPQGQQSPGGYGSNAAEWPYYQYPQYHNPYYQGVNPQEAISGTIDWFFTLPAHLMDRIANFLDGNFFPQAPATQGVTQQQPGQAQSTTQGGPGVPSSPPQAGLPNPQR